MIVYSNIRFGHELTYHEHQIFSHNNGLDACQALECVSVADINGRENLEFCSARSEPFFQIVSLCQQHESGTVPSRQGRERRRSSCRVDSDPGSCR